MDAALGNCQWEDPHPPHLWASEMKLPTGAKIKIWACNGEGPEE